MPTVTVRHPVCGVVAVFEEDIPKFGVPLEILPPIDCVIEGRRCRFSRGTRYQIPSDPENPNYHVLFDGKERVFDLNALGI